MKHTYKLICILLMLTMLSCLLLSCKDDPAQEPSDDPGQVEQPEGPSEPAYDPKQDNEVVATLNLIADGASEYVIVRGKEATPAEVTAATELQKYLKAISGVELPIVTDDTAAIKTEIVVGKTNREADGEFDRKKLGDDGFTIKTRAKRLFLVGGEQRGTLYSVYEFLEAYMGCRFYTASFEKVPENKTVTLDAIEGDTQKPVFTQRILYSYDYLQTELSGSVFSAKRKINLRRWGVYDDAYGGSQIWAGHPCHSMQYSLGDLASKYPGRQQPCLTDEDVYQQILSDALQWLEQTPGADVISISQKDTESYCRCENCAALEKEYGSYAGVILTFVNRMAEEIAKEYPDIWVHTMAYRGTDPCPDGIEPADNVVVELGAVYECNRHPLEDAEECTTTRSSVPYNQKIEDWAEICMNDNLFITYFTTDFYDYSLSYPDFEVLHKDIRYFADNGAKSLMVHGNYQGVSLEFEELRSYLASKLMWNPYMSADEYEALMMEFLIDFYGPGAESIREYITVMHEASEDNCIFMQSSAFDMYDLIGKSVQNHESKTVPDGLTVEMIRDYENVDWSQYVYWYSSNTPHIISEGDRLFAQALEMAETDEQRARIERCHVQVDVLRSYHLYQEKNKTSTFVATLFGTGIPSVFPGEFSDSELRTIKNEVNKLIQKQVAAAYVEYNETLAQTMKSYNTFVREAEWTPYPDDPEKRKNKRDYSQVPTNWLVE